MYDNRHDDDDQITMARPQQQQRQPSQETINRPQRQPPLHHQQQQEHFQIHAQHSTTTGSSTTSSTQQSPCSSTSSRQRQRRPIRTLLGNWMDRQRSLRQQRTIEREILTIQSKIQEQQQETLTTSTSTGSTKEDSSSDSFQIQLELPSSEGGDASATTAFQQLLTQDEMQQLHSHLPDVLRDSCKANTWKCLYSLYRDGDSFDTFLSNVSSYKQTLLVLQTSTNERLGGFVEEEWKHTSGGGIVGTTTTSISTVTTDTTSISSLGGKEFYGSGRAFLFSITTQQEVAGGSSKVNVYPWTGKNRYIQYCCQLTKTIAMGGGGGSFGFVIQNNFTTGSTGRCDTFDNSPLLIHGDTSSPNNSVSAVEELQLFDIIDVEVYTFVGSI